MIACCGGVYVLLCDQRGMKTERVLHERGVRQVWQGKSRLLPIGFLASTTLLSVVVLLWSYYSPAAWFAICAGVGRGNLGRFPHDQEAAKVIAKALQKPEIALDGQDASGLVIQSVIGVNQNGP